MDKKSNFLLNFFILSIWILITLYAITYHSMWRDEVRNFMIGIGATSSIHILGNPHPFLIYAIERLGFSITRSYGILPVSSYLFSLLSVCIILYLSPFSRGKKILLIFGYPILYEYTVMSRNYGISMLLMLILAMVFSSNKYRYRLTGPVLFFLANTNVHSSFIAAFFSIIWPLNTLREHKWQWHPDVRAAMYNGLIGLGGVIICIATIYPPRYDTAAAHPMETRQGHHFKIRFFDDLTIKYAFQHYYGIPLKVALPQHYGAGITTGLVYGAICLIGIAYITMPIFIFYGDVFLFTLSLSVFICFIVFFSIIYSGSYRHEALWIFFLSSLMWIKITKNPKFSEGRLNRAGYTAFYILLASQAIQSVMLEYHEVKTPNSMAKNFSGLVLGHNGMKDSPILSSVDYTLESLPYYLKNPLFMMTLHHFDKVAPYKNQYSYTLDDLLDTAQKLSETSRNAPLILITNDDTVGTGHGPINIMDDVSRDSYRSYTYNYWNFTATSAQKIHFLNHVHEVARYPNGYLEEGFIVYQLIAK